MLQSIEVRWPDLRERVATLITPERVYRYLQCIGDVYAPSQTVPWTRGPVVERLLHEDGLLGLPTVHYSSNYRGTGNPALLLGGDLPDKQVWLMSHLDTVSYLVEPPVRGLYPLTHVCYHLASGERRGLALEFCQGRGMVPVARGVITSRAERIEFRPDHPVELRAGHRVVFESQMQWDRSTGIVEGLLDDAGGAAACLVAAGVLAHYPVEVLVSLADEEEAPPGAGNQTFSRGGKRLTQHFAAPQLAVVVDSHVTGDPAHAEPRDFRMGDGASFTEKASGARGGFVSPPLMALQRCLAAELGAAGLVVLRENAGGYVPRSECVNAIERTPNIIVTGFLNENRHFDSGPPRGHIGDLTNVARALVYYTLLIGTPEWTQLFG